MIKFTWQYGVDPRSLGQAGLGCVRQRLCELVDGGLGHAVPDHPGGRATRGVGAGKDQQPVGGLQVEAGQAGGDR